MNADLKMFRESSGIQEFAQFGVMAMGQLVVTALFVVLGLIWVFTGLSDELVQRISRFGK